MTLTKVETYALEMMCNNCGKEQGHVTIPKGTDWENFVADKKCQTCGCSELGRSMAPYY